jgi:hypothetical protein
MDVIGSQYSHPQIVGDFGWMITQPAYADALFIFNDNEEQFRAFVNDPTAPYGCQKGANNAAIRPFRCSQPPRAAGIPTGTLAHGGYSQLTTHAQSVIDEAFGIVKATLAAGTFDRIFYSAANAKGELGTGVFVIGDDVKRYIVSGLRAFAT